jgi:hypothetical protein
MGVHGRFSQTQNRREMASKIHNLIPKVPPEVQKWLRSMSSDDLYITGRILSDIGEEAS